MGAQPADTFLRGNENDISSMFFYFVSLYLSALLIHSSCFAVTLRLIFKFRVDSGHTRRTMTVYHSY